jgi:hypothetical protein
LPKPSWSENGNQASIYTMGGTAEEADDKLMGALVNST